MWFYLPKNKARIYRSQKTFYNDNIYKKYRRHKWWNYWKIREWLWFFAFLMFAFRIGGISFFTLFDIHGYEAANLIYRYPGRIKLPETKAVEYLSSRRNIVVISIHQDGYIMVEGVHYADEELSDVLRAKLWENPRAVAGLVIDKDCEMHRVNALLKALRKSEFVRLCFITKETRAKNPSESGQSAY